MEQSGLRILNRPVKVVRAYRDGQGALQAGSTIATMQYDGLGRRIVKAISNSADWDCDYNYYWDGWRMIETRNGSDEVLRQQVYGRGYVDELVQIGINQDPSNANSQSNAENDCERFVYVLQDANYNVLGVATSTGRLIERYEYTPYGQRTIFSHGWLRADINDDGFVGQGDLDIVLGDWGHTGAGIANPCADLSGDGSVGQADLDIYLASSGEALASDDPLVSMAVLASGQGRDGLAAGLCDFGHQGLMHDREFSLLYNRMRYLDPVLARFMTTDLAGYTDGMNRYQYVGGRPTRSVDPSGLVMQVDDIGPFSAFDHWRDGTGETIRVIGLGFIRHVQGIKAVRFHIHNLEVSMQDTMKRDAQTVACGGSVSAVERSKNQGFTMTGWRWAAFGTAYHDYLGKCVGKKKCLDKPLHGNCAIVEYRCIYNVSGHDRYHNFVKLQRMARGYVGKPLYWLLWLWGKEGSSTLNRPKPFDILWHYQQMTSGQIGIQEPLPKTKPKPKSNPIVDWGPDLPLPG